MARARFGWRNLALGSTLTATSSSAGAPVGNLLIEHPKVVWRTAHGTDSVALVLSWPEDVSLDGVVLDNTSLSADATVRVRVSTTDDGGAAGDAYDSGTVAAAVDPRYPRLIHLLPASATGRSLRIDLADTGADHVSAGRLGVFLTVELSRNYAFGWQPRWEDRNERHRSGGGQTWVLPRPSARGARLTFRAITEAEALGIVEDINREAHTARDVLIIRDPASANRGRDSYWGLLSEPVDNTHMVIRYHTATFEIMERL